MKKHFEPELYFVRTNFLSYICIVIFIYASEPASIHSAPAQTENTNLEAGTLISTGSAEQKARKHTADTTRTNSLQKISIPCWYGLFHSEYFRSADFYSSDYQADISERQKFYDGFELPEEWLKKLGREALIIGVVDMLLNPVQKGLTPEYYGENFSDYGYVVRKESDDTSGHYTVLFKLFRGYDEQAGPQYKLQELNRAVRREIAAMGKRINVLLSQVDSTSVMVEAIAPGADDSDIETEVKKYTFYRSEMKKYLLEQISELTIRKVKEGKLSVDSLDYTVKSSPEIDLFGSDEEIRKVLCSEETYTIIDPRYITFELPQGIIPQLDSGDSLSFFLPLITSSSGSKEFLCIIDYDKRTEDARRKMYIVSLDEKGERDVKFQMDLSFIAPFGIEPIRSFVLGKEWFFIKEEYGMRYKSFLFSHFRYDQSMQKWIKCGESSSEETCEGGVQSLGVRHRVDEYRN